MVKHQEKNNSNFTSIYGDGLILNVNKSNGCLEVSIHNEISVLLQKNTVFVSSILCAIALLGFLLGISTCIITLAFTCMFYILYEMLFFVKEEKVLIIKGFGYHISKKHWFGKRTIFIPHEQVQKVFINEVILRHSVIYLLTLLTKEWAKEEYEHKLVPLFLNLLPRINCLKIIYKNIKYLEGR